MLSSAGRINAAHNALVYRKWWARSDSTNPGKPLKRLQYQGFELQGCRYAPTFVASASPDSGGVEFAYRENILRTHGTNRRRLQPHERLSTTRSGDEFHLDRVLRVRLYHGAYVPGCQSLARHVDLQFRSTLRALPAAMPKIAGRSPEFTGSPALAVHG